MLEACIAADQGREKHQLSLSIDEIMHECKTFFFAGYETTSLLLTWTVFLLSVYPEWQARLRLEVLTECGEENPNGDNMSMVFLETLRLYGPALFFQRKALTDITLGETKIPKGSAIIIPLVIMHQDKEVWGDDADEFNPLRFENGVTRAAKVPHALLAFSIGPRSCIGQNFAMLEAKSVMAMMLKKFSFTLSPSYVHAPADVFTLQPKFGLPVVLAVFMDSIVLLALVALLVVAISWLWDYTIVRLIWRPYRTAKEFREKFGIHGPAYKFLEGNNEEISSMKKEGDGQVLDIHDHNYLPRIAPHYLRWRDQYGEPFLFWYGPKPRICIFDYELARQILSSKSGHFLKNDAPQTLVALMGKGLVLVEGTNWVRHRRVINPAFNMDKLKMMIKTMMDCAQSLANELEDVALKNNNRETEVEFNRKFRELTADIISHTAFGSSYRLGKEAFHAQHDLTEITMATLFQVQLPGFNYLPTERNRRKWKLEKNLRNALMQIIQLRLASKDGEYDNDLLGLMLGACTSDKQGEVSLSMDEIIDECKTFFFAGHETTALLLTWTVFLLSVYPEWQERLRNEMTMVLLETLRLYNPAIFIQRKPTTDITVGSLKIPAGVAVYIPIPIMHRDKQVWGEDADKFNPLRFQNGVTRAAKIPHALLSFSIGPRSCIGQNFAMLEAKSVMAVMLRKFSFSVSPGYMHAPVDIITLKPKFGLPVIVKLLGE
uniref:Cytochrome P450 n=1 Tax=Leersia perrieri TaxID=77586 RepID=A0A0D9VUF9_9ORYZ